MTQMKYMKYMIVFYHLPQSCFSAVQEERGPRKNKGHKNNTPRDASHPISIDHRTDLSHLSLYKRDWVHSSMLNLNTDFYHSYLNRLPSASRFQNVETLSNSAFTKVIPSSQTSHKNQISKWWNVFHEKGMGNTWICSFRDRCLFWQCPYSIGDHDPLVIYSRFSRNSKASASEFLGNLDEIYLVISNILKYVN